ncbi:MAG: dihydroorotate dehydrogenase-like protein [Prolixibacteraceae bacterium]|jgi:dihydroorotate dehydrogenase (fumarate)|nr:dihydroorotate dehydrogenase-like protein [Prolixibacteraceae bacterium]MBT6004330.1 dihydroorotate dehydrogenase-like protein [Prolixibacteraceae bacterium]MBT6766599.1 dihydroorotate dehydrogenase-like protein [Prolixibacteraceae bacterium]MBT6998308.1 dihydroorotate dehydrogenase-like protein [Prolixibacteraceae bacterium]MBT7396446.1 dihydroorotate dehydrogenase-like protein [Prolixibacteraceae bacterium]
MDISTSYMGLKLKSPIIVGSSSLTENVENSVAYEKAGAGAIVLKSLFEEQILHDVDEQRLNNMYGSFNDQEYYAMYYSKKHNLDQYINLIKKNKEALDIPVIASINCVSSEEWISYAKMIESAGADALEVNLFLLPAEVDITGVEKENIYFEIIEKISEAVTIPFSLKISYYFSGLANFIYRIAQTKASSVVLFNKFYSPDVDIETEKVMSGDVLSCKELNVMTLRWIGILYDKVDIEFTASRGIFTGEQVIKNLLVGAQTTQIVSAVYKDGPKIIESMIHDLKDWMFRHKYNTIDEFRGNASQKNIKKPVLYQRTQFMRYFSDASYK